VLLSNPSFHAKTVTADVQTAQVAPTILRALRLGPDSLDAVRGEGTPSLPALQFGEGENHLIGLIPWRVLVSTRFTHHAPSRPGLKE
jgi:hypothetical protein